MKQESPPSGKRDVEDPGEQSSPDVMHETEESEESDQELDIEEEPQL